MKFAKLILLSALLSNLFLLTGCQNTVEGFGKDMQQAGSNIQKSA